MLDACCINSREDFMKLTQWIALVNLVALTAVAAESPKNAGFEKMKSLVGQWRGKTQDGSGITVTYRLVAAGSVLEEQLSVADMITMYHVDGKSLMLTHYCAAGNQPRMKAAPFKEGDNTLAFVFLDATN
jgi:hypothetical protein